MSNTTEVDIAYLDIQLKRLVKILDSLEGDVKYLSDMLARLEGKGSACRHEVRVLKTRLGIIEAQVTS